MDNRKTGEDFDEPQPEQPESLPLVPEAAANEAKPVNEAQLMAQMANQKAHITVVETVYYQRPGGQTLPYQSSYSRFIENDEQPYSREVKLCEEWVKLDKGWLEVAGLLHIQNVPERFSRQPSVQERESAAAKIIDIAFVPAQESKLRDMHSPKRQPIVANCYILPGETTRIHPADLNTIYLRSQCGVAKCLISIIPA
jgi:hypothetical protein